MLDFITTKLQLSAQWENPSDVTTVLMVIGGDVVQKALAQTTGCLYTPVCFSFGWVTYAFMALVGIIGDGRLLPPPDYPVKVFNLGSGYCRENKNWTVGRIMRDMEAYMSRVEPMGHSGIRISIWKAEENPNRHTKHSYSKIHILGLVTTVVQLAIASIPLILYGDWGILLLTVAGTLLALVAGALPQWRVEKLPNRQHSNAKFALTSGNGSKDIMIVMGNGHCLDLEELCAQETPRNGKPWEKFEREQPGLFTKPQRRPDDSLLLHRTGTQVMSARTIWGLPSGFWITLCVCVVQSLAWLVILITSAALSQNTWFLILIGVLGMFQNAYLAAVERSPRHRNLPLKMVETIVTQKVMDGLMDFESVYRCGRPLVSEFFPGPLREEETAWWSGDTQAYDEGRVQSKTYRGVPRSFMRKSPSAHSLTTKAQTDKAPLAGQDSKRPDRTSAGPSHHPYSVVAPTPLQGSIEADLWPPKSPPLAHQTLALGTPDEMSFEKSGEGWQMSSSKHASHQSLVPSQSSTFQHIPANLDTTIGEFPEWMG